METPDMPLPPRPPLTIDIGDRVIKMTYGLEMDIRRLLPDPMTALQLMQSDAYTQDYVVRRVLTNKNKIITDDAELIPFEEIDLDSDKIEEVMAWATEHALYFFVKRVTSLSKLGSQYMPAAPLKPTTDGFENSAMTTPSAGPSE